MGRKNRKCAMRPRKGGSNLISALREGGVRADCDKERDENRDPGESLTRAQNRSPPQNNLLGCAETCKFCFDKHLVNLSARSHENMGQSARAQKKRSIARSTRSLFRRLRTVEESRFLTAQAVRNEISSLADHHFGRVIAPSEADATSAAYLPKTPVG